MNAVGMLRDVNAWSPSEDPHAVRRRCEAAKRERKEREQTRDEERRRSMAETARVSQMPMPQSRVRLSAGAISRDRAQHAQSWERAFRVVLGGGGVR